MKIGTMSATLLENCNIDENAVEMALALAIDIPNAWLPVPLRSRKSKTVNAYSILKKIEAEEKVIAEKLAAEKTKQDRKNRLTTYAEDIDSEKELYSEELTIEEQLAVDRNYIRCYADFVQLGILKPITFDDIQDFESELDD